MLGAYRSTSCIEFIEFMFPLFAFFKCLISPCRGLCDTGMHILKIVTWCHRAMFAWISQTLSSYCFERVTS